MERGVPETRPPASSSRVLAIDGGAATGKTTSAARVARRLGFSYVDSGAIYRSIALALGRAGVEDAADARLPDLAREVDVRIAPARGRFEVFLDGRPVTEEEIRAPEVSSLSSRLAVHPAVRDRVRELLRDARRYGSLVVEGRDIGTVVFPDADLKVFLTTDLTVRAERRRLDLSRQGRDCSAEEVARDLEERDRRDASRAIAPLRPAEDAVVIDTSRTDIEGQVEAIVRAFRSVLESREPPAGPAGSPA